MISRRAFLAGASALLLCACSNAASSTSSSALSSAQSEAQSTGTSSSSASSTSTSATSASSSTPTGTPIIVGVNETVFSAYLEDNDTAKAFVKLLPTSYQMRELNGNEKYFQLESPLPAKPTKTKRVEAGDIMLYGDSYLVLFYEDHETEYEYTRIGKLADATGLAQTVGVGDVVVTFSPA